MGYTKREYIAAAFDEIGMAGYVFDLEPEQLQSALRRLDAMMAEWNAKGIRLGYPLPLSPTESDLDEQTSVPDSANEAIITNLGIRLAPSLGKTVTPDTKITAKLAYNTVLACAAMPNEMQFPSTLPSGAGNKPYSVQSVFLPGPVDSVQVGQDGILELE